MSATLSTQLTQIQPHTSSNATLQKCYSIELRVGHACVVRLHKKFARQDDVLNRCIK